jgi:alcohol dehydrogenase
MIGVASGARVVAVDVVGAALAKARELGAEAVVDAGQSPAAAIREITGGGAHVSIDAFGSAIAATASVACLRRRGRHVQVGLLHGAQATPPLPMDVVIAQELAIFGSHGMAAHEYPAMLAMVADGTLRPDLLVGDVIGLADAGAALADMDRATSPGMTVIELS